MCYYVLLRKEPKVGSECKHSLPEILVAMRLKFL